MNVVLGLCMFPGSSLLFWAKNWVKTGPKIAPSDSADYADRVRHAIASPMRTRHSAFCFSTRARCPRLRVACAIPSARSREPCSRVNTIFSLSRGRVIHAAASLLAGHLLNFLCSFYFCRIRFQSPTHSCPIKPETLNTQITASNGIKEN